MNSRYWGKTVIKFLNITIVCPTSATMTAKLKKAASKLACWLVILWSRKPYRQWTEDMLAREHVSSQDMLTRKFISTQSMLTREARKNWRHIDTWTKKYAKHVGTPGTLAHEHVFST